MSRKCVLRINMELGDTIAPASYIEESVDFQKTESHANKAEACIAHSCALTTPTTKAYEINSNMEHSFAKKRMHSTVFRCTFC